MNEAGVSFSRHPISKLDTRYVNVTGDIMTGGLTIQPTIDTLTALVVNDTDANNILTVDTVHNRVGIGTTIPTAPLEVSGCISQINTGLSLFIGEGAGLNDDLTDNYNVFLGYSAGYSNTSGRTNVFIGAESGFTNTTGYANVFIGRLSGYENINGNLNFFLGSEAGRSNTSGSYNVFLGAYAGYSNTTASDNIFIGRNAGYKNVGGSRNIAIGRECGYDNVSGSDNIAIGYYAGEKNTAYYNLFFGYYSGGKTTTGGNNVYIGYEAGHYGTTGSNNQCLGYQANKYNQTGGNNTILGYQAGRGTSSHSKSGNVFLGYQAGYSEVGSNKLYIENSNSSSPLIWGDFANDILNFNGRVGIGTTGPTTKLDVNYGSQIAANTNILTISVPGQAAAGQEMRLRFYNSVSPGYEEGYIGSAFDTDTTGGYLAFGTRTSGATTEKVRIDKSGNVGIGTTAPTAVLHLKAGTATASTAPLKLTTGTSLTTPEAGTFEFTTDSLYFTITTGPTRKTIAFETGVSGSFTTVDLKTVTVVNGLITAIV